MVSIFKKKKKDKDGKDRRKSADSSVLAPSAPNPPPFVQKQPQQSLQPNNPRQDIQPEVQQQQQQQQQQQAKDVSIPIPTKTKDDISAVKKTSDDVSIASKRSSSLMIPKTASTIIASQLAKTDNDKVSSVVVKRNNGTTQESAPSKSKDDTFSLPPAAIAFAHKSKGRSSGGGMRKRNFSFFNIDEFKELSMASTIRKPSTKEENTRPSSNESQDAPLVFKQLYSEQFYNAFYELKLLSRDLNTQLPIPEYVLIGKRGQGKSALLESLLGYTINYVCDSPDIASSFGATMRPIFYQLVNNPEYDTVPKFTLKYNTGDGEDEKKAQASQLLAFNDKRTSIMRDVSLAELRVEIERLSKLSHPCPEPVYVVVQHKCLLDMILIDTPGLVMDDEQFSPIVDDAVRLEEGDDDKRDIKLVNEMVYDLIFPQHRKIIAVEEANYWSDIKILNFIKTVDPAFTRMTLVLTHFHSMLRNFHTPQDLRRFLTLSPHSASFFFISLFSSKVRSKFCNTSEEFIQRITQAFKRDKRGMEMLNYDTRFRKNLGIQLLRQHIIHNVVQSYQANIPQLVNNIRTTLRSTEQYLQKLSKHPLRSVENAEQQKIALRSISSAYLTQFLKIISELISGTIEGIPLELGETVAEEIEASGLGPWMDENYQEISTPGHSSPVEYGEQKLYGGQQIKRLLSEFKYICQNIEFDDISVEDIILNSGASITSESVSFSSVVWAASELSQQRANALFKSLIQQLIQRSIYVLKRVPLIVQRVMKNRKAERNLWIPSHKEQEEMKFERYPYFISKVRQMFEEFVEQTASKVLTLCEDEFVETRSIYWIAMLDPKLKEGVDQNDMTHERIKMIAKRVFNGVRDRVTGNVILKVFNNLLIPMKEGLFEEIYGKFSMIEMEELQQIFELSAVESTLESEQQRLKQLFNTSLEQESLFLRNSSIFTQQSQQKKKKTQYFSNEADRIRERLFKYNLHGLESDKWGLSQPASVKKTAKKVSMKQVSFTSSENENVEDPKKQKISKPVGTESAKIAPKFIDEPKKMIRFDEPTKIEMDGGDEGSNNEKDGGEKTEDTVEQNTNNGIENENTKQEKKEKIEPKPEVLDVQKANATASFSQNEKDVKPNIDNNDKQEIKDEEKSDPVKVEPMTTLPQAQEEDSKEESPKIKPPPVFDDEEEEEEVQEEEVSENNSSDAPKDVASKLPSTLYPDSDGEGDIVDEEYYNERLDEYIDMMNEDDESLETLDLHDIDDKLSSLSDVQLQDFAAALGQTQCVKRAILRGKGLDNALVIMLCMFLKKNTTLIELDLSENKIDEGSAQAISILLQANNALEKLNISDTFINSSGIDTILDGISENTSLKSLKLNSLASEDNKSRLKTFLERQKDK